MYEAIRDRPEVLASLYQAVQRNEPRAVGCFHHLGFIFESAGRQAAEKVNSLPCLAANVLPGCRMSWQLDESFLKAGPGGEQLSLRMHQAFDARHRQLEPQRVLTKSAADVYIAASVLRETLVAPRPGGGQGTGASKPAAGAGTGALSAEALSSLERSTGVAREVLEAKLAQAEGIGAGPRFPRDVGALQKHRPAVAQPPLGVPAESSLWADYVAYWEGRFTELSRPPLPSVEVKPPLTWDAYQQFRGDFARSLEYQRNVAAMLQSEAENASAPRRFLQSFRSPRVERNAGVRKPGSTTIRYADQLVIETDVPRGVAPRVETFSNKSRDWRKIPENHHQAQVAEDVREVLDSYGGMLDIRRPSLGLRDQPIAVTRVHLVYDARYRPLKSETLDAAIDTAAGKGVVVHWR
jgi:hypothetical protein